MIILREEELKELGVVCNEKEITPKVDQNTAATEKLAAAIEMLAQCSDQPNVQVIFSALKYLQQTQTELIKALRDLPIPESAPKSWEFAVERDSEGAITRINAIGS